MKRPGLRISVGLNLLLAAALAAIAWWGAGALRAFTDQLHERRQTQFEELRPRGGIVFVGDSITEGGMWSELFGRPDVWNRGIGGDTTAGVLSRMDTLVAIRPRQIFLMIGVNDLNRGAPREETLRNYEAILDAFARELPDTEVVVQAVLPVAASWRWADNEKIRALNEEIEALARARGLDFVDLTPLFADDTGALDPRYTNDGIHLLGPAYAKWRDRLADRLAPPVPPGTH